MDPCLPKRSFACSPHFVGVRERAFGFVAGSHVDVALLDVNTPRLGGIEAARRIHGMRLSPVIAVLTSLDDEALLR